MRTELIVWACVSLLLMAAEMLAPGAFMLWLGFAAAGVFALLLVVSLTPVWQAVVFALLSIVSVSMYWRIFRRNATKSDQPLLNRRAEQLVGQTYPLDTAIVDGRGRLKIGDAFWAVEGPDLPVRASVRVVAVHGMSLRVQAAD
jgi:membrane protein implicated in regulation of membrane protease activity